MIARKETIMIEYQIIKNIFSLESSGSYKKELNLVSWGDRDPVYDLRGWNEDHSKMTKGITFSQSEFEELVKKFKGGYINSEGRNMEVDHRKL